MYGLTLSNDYQEIIRDCLYVYHDWLSVLLDEPKAFVPLPIREEPIIYSRKMLWHLYHLFVPRKESPGLLLSIINRLNLMLNFLILFIVNQLPRSI
jgi:hypothetical protein